jgi:hypothetical protein
MEIEHKEFELIKSKLARSIKDILTKESATPPGEKNTPCEVHIPYHHIKPVDDADSPDTAQATVTYVVSCPMEKKHTVRIKFKYDKNGKFLRNSMIYV